jgi:hypothetical protein
MNATELLERFANTAPSFQRQVNAKADECGKTPMEVYSMWRTYCQDCHNFDQSPIWGEFLNWYAKDLQPVVKGGA